MRVKLTVIILALIIVSGFAFRITGINFGLPYQFHQDEPIIVNHALAYGSGDLNPHFFAIPPLTSYILFILYGAYFIFGKLFFFFANPKIFAESFFIDPSVFYIIGRIFIGVIPGTLAVFFTYLLCRRMLLSIPTALYSCSIIAFSFINVTDSHFIYTDMLLLTSIILTVSQIIKTRNIPSLKNYIATAALIGFAIAIKYNAAILIIPALLMHFQLSLEKKGDLINKKLVLSFCAVIFTFIIANPFALLDFNSFIHLLLKQKGAGEYIGWTHHIFYSLKEGLGSNFLIIGISGLIIFALKLKKIGLIFLSFPIVFYLHLVFLSQKFPRYIIPLTPFLAIGAGYLLYELVFPKIKARVFKFLFIIFSFCLLIPCIAKDLKIDSLFLSKDTRIEAKTWIEKNLDKNLKIALDHTFFRPAISQNSRQLKTKLESLDKHSLEYKKLALAIAAKTQDQGNYIYFLSNDNPEIGYLNSKPKLPFNLKKLKDEGISYVIINFSDQNKENEFFYQQLNQNAKLIASFSPYNDNSVKMSSDQIATTCVPVISKEVFSRSKLGPAMKIYELK